MIILDTTFLSVFLNENPPPAKDRKGQVVPFFKERVSELIANLNASDEVIGIPAPVLAEILVRAGKQKGQFLTILNDRYRFQVLPFGARAAIEAGELISKIRSETKGQTSDTWAKLKFDAQIVATAKAESATIIYSDDRGIETNGKRMGIRVLRICDLSHEHLFSRTNAVQDTLLAGQAMLPLQPAQNGEKATLTVPDEAVVIQTHDDLADSETFSEATAVEPVTQERTIGINSSAEKLPARQTETAPRGNVSA